MTQFEEMIKVDNESLFFSFIQIDIRQKFVVTVNKDRQYFVFDMKKDSSEKWKISDLVPQWLNKIEDQLSNVINREIRSGKNN